MTKKEIIQQLNKTTASRENRIEVANLVLQDKTNFNNLLKIVFKVDDKLSIKAAWVLEFVCKKQLSWLYENLDYFTKNIKKIHFGSAVRPIAKICQLLVLKNAKTPILNFTAKNKENIIETAFDWMISNHKVAIKAYTMQTLFYLGKEQKWIHDELEIILQNNIDSETAAYKSRGLITIAQIKKFKKN